MSDLSQVHRLVALAIGRDAPYSLRMSDFRVVSSGHPSGDRPKVEPAAGVERSPTVGTFACKVYIEWAPVEAVTPLGQVPFFIDRLGRVIILALPCAGSL